MKTKNWSVYILIAFVVLNFLLMYGLSILIIPEAKEGLDDLFPFVGITTLILLVCQALMLGLKIDVIEVRPVAKRKITWLSIVIGMLMAVISFTILVVLLFVAMGEKSNAFGPLQDALPYLLLVFFLLTWFFWAYVFMVKYWNNNPQGYLQKVTGSLLTGSVLELLVAIPSHIYMRQRGDCCAPIFSYFGIVTGAAIMLCAFGPGIVFLFVKRIKDKKPANR